MKRALLFGVIVAVGVVSMRMAGAQAPKPAPLPAIEKVRDNLYVIAGSDASDRAKFTGGNVGVFVTDGGVVLVDTKLANYGQAILDQVKTVTNKPVTTIINTHTHGDHTGSNEFFPASVDIVAHENTKANMQRMDAFKGDKARFVPKRTYKDKMTVGSGKDRVDLYHFGPGHTNGDTFVVYPALRVLQTGDMFAWRDAPFIDRSSGGSGVEIPNTLSKAIAGIKDIDIGDPRPQSRDHAGRLAAVPALHGRPAGRDALRAEGGQERGRRGRGQHAHDEVSGLQIGAGQGSGGSHLRRAAGEIGSLRSRFKGENRQLCAVGSPVRESCSHP